MLVFHLKRLQLTWHALCQILLQEVNFYLLVVIEHITVYHMIHIYPMAVQGAVMVADQLAWICYADLVLHWSFTVHQRRN